MKTFIAATIIFALLCSAIFGISSAVVQRLGNHEILSYLCIKKRDKRITNKKRNTVWKRNIIAQYVIGYTTLQ